MASDSEATADVDIEAEVAGVDQAPSACTAAASESAAVSKQAVGDDEATEDEEPADEEDEEEEEDADMDYDELKAMPLIGRKGVPSRRSRASSPEFGLLRDDARLTARQRARLEKEAGLAEDVQWHEMSLPSELAYSWKGDKRYKAAELMTEEEWLKRQEGLERRRMRSLRDKREAEENVKAKIRKAVTAKFRGKLLADTSATEGEGGAATEAGPEQTTRFIRPGYYKVRQTGADVMVVWPPHAHPLSYPTAVSGQPPPPEPVELDLQPASADWQVPDSSSGTFKPGCMLKIHIAEAEQHQQGQQQQGDGVDLLKQQQLLCLDGNGWAVGFLTQQQVLEAFAAVGHDWMLRHQQQKGQLQQSWQQQDLQQQQQPDVPLPDILQLSRGPWHTMNVMVRSIRHASQAQHILHGVTVRVSCEA